MRALFFLLLFIIPVWRALQRDYEKGLYISLTLFAFMTNRLELDFGPFEMTFPRILLIVVTIYWFQWRNRQESLAKVPYLNLIKFWWVMALCSMVFSEDFGSSLKWFISFSTQVVLFYVIVGESIRDEADVMKAYKALCVSTGIVAVLGMIEYYRGFNPALDWMGAYQEKDTEDVIVTFQHRILFGYAVAMGWPLLLTLSYRAQGWKKVWTLKGLAMAALACCYFSNSRGAWFGSAIAGVVMFFLGTSKVRKSMITFLLLSVFVVIARPGVRATLVDLTMSTFDPDSYRGASYYYRKELWPMAIKLVSNSPIRMLFGCGPDSLEHMDLYSHFTYGGSTYHTGFSSWDNNYAANFAEFGCLGFLAQILFCIAVFSTFCRLALRGPPVHRDIIAAMAAAVAIYLFSQTNVYMFSPQLKCIFYTLAVIGGRLESLYPTGYEESDSRADLQTANEEVEPHGEPGEIATP